MGGSAILGGASLAGGLLNYFGAKSASDNQVDAAKQANALQFAMFRMARHDLSPYRQMGFRSSNKLQAALPGLTKPFDPGDLTKTPGYQFVEQEGQKGLANSYAAAGLGSSGALEKAQGQYAAGLASTTYQQQLQNYLAQNMQKYNMLMGTTQVGEAAAAGTAQAGMATGAQVGSNLIGAGNAAAAGIIGGTNALAGGINNAAQMGLSYNLMNRLYPGA